MAVLLLGRVINLHIMKYLIDEQGCDPSCLDTDQETPLHHAACEGHLHVIKYLIDEQRCYSSSLNRDKETPLHLAAYSGHLDFVKFLTLEKHCNPTLRNSFGSSHSFGKLNMAIWKYLKSSLTI